MMAELDEQLVEEQLMYRQQVECLNRYDDKNSDYNLEYYSISMHIKN